MLFANKIDELIRTKESKTAFNLINRLSIIHPTKRDGGIMKCFLKEDDTLVVNRDEVLQSCLQVIGKLSGIEN